MRADHFSADVQALICHGHPRLTGEVDFWFDQQIELEGGRQVQLPVIGLAELVRNKRAAGRHKTATGTTSTR